VRIDYSLIDEVSTLWEQKKADLKRLEKECGKFTGNVFFVSDLHSPIVDKHAVKAMLHDVKQTNGDKIFVAGGDWVTFDLFSRFDKDEPRSDLEREVKIAGMVLSEVSRYCNRVIFEYANHELRLRKFLFRLATDSQGAAIAKLIGDWLKVPGVKHIHNWFLKIGDAIFAHPHLNRAAPASALIAMMRRFMGKVDYNTLVMGHTHKQSKIFWMNKLGIQSGAMCRTQDYAVADGRLYEGSQEIGYAKVKMTKGKTDINESGFVFLKFEDKLL
jgi:hypothetical protein